MKHWAMPELGFELIHLGGVVGNAPERRAADLGSKPEPGKTFLLN